MQSEVQTDNQPIERRGLLQTLLQHLPGFCFYLKPDAAFSTEYVSPGVEFLTGYSVADFIGERGITLFSIIHTDDRKRVDDQLIFALQNKQTFEMNFRILTKTGEEKWIWERGTGIWDEKENLVAIEGFATEFTETKRAENIIKERGQTLQNIFNFSPVPMMITRIHDGMIMMANEGAEKLLGIRKVDLIGKKTPESYFSKNERVKILDELTSHKKIINRETQVKNAKHKNIPCLLSIEIIKMNGESMYLKSFIDISERKQMEDAVQESEDNLRTVFEHTEVGYILFDQQQHIISFNKPASKFAIQEFNKDIKVGTHFINFFPEIMHEYLTNIITPVLNGKTASFERYIEHQEDNHWYYVKFAPVFTKKHKVAGFIMSIENITQRKRDNIALNKSLEIVTEQNKRLLNFSYIVSHNLRSHTSNMISLLNFLEREQSEKEKAYLFQHLKKVSGLLNETLHNLNEVVSIQQNLNTTIDKLNLHDYINQTIDVLNKEINSKNAIITNSVSPDCTINYNPAYLESILLNFLSNAIKYASPDRQPEILLEATKTGNTVELYVRDNGLGIDLKKFNDRLFGMYKTFHGNKDARGIGLFITKNQIDAMGGKIEVSSEINKGTTFKISFL